MRRRFGRRRPRGEEGRGAPLDPRWLERLVESGALPLARLEARSWEDLPGALALAGLGETPEGERWAVGFAPRRAGDALLAAVVAAERLAPEGVAQAAAVAPAWDVAGRRRLGLLGPLAVPLRAVAAPGLADAGPPVDPEPFPEPPAVAPERVAAQLAGAEERALFRRALAALGGLAAKHEGALRGARRSVELVVRARRVGALRADASGVLLEGLHPARFHLRLSHESLAEALDRLEGGVRKHLSDKRARDGEEGLRARALPELARTAGLRWYRPWPAGGAEGEGVDLVGVGEDGRPALAFVRRRLDLEALGAAIDATLALGPVLPSLLAEVEGPVELAPPRLLLAAERLDPAAEAVARHLALDATAYELDARTGALRARGLRPAEARPAPEAPRERAPEPRPEPLEEAVEAAGPPAEPAATGAAEEGAGAEEEGGRARRGRRRGRGRGRRRREERAPEAAGEGAAAQAPAEAGPSYDEVSLFELDEEMEAAPESGAAGRRRGGRARGKSRRGRGGRDEGEAAGGRAGAAAEPSEAPRRGGGRGERREPREEGGERAEEAADEDEETLAPLAAEVPELEEPAWPPRYEEELEEGEEVEAESALDRIRLERERRRLARHAKAAPPAAAAAEAESAEAAARPRLPRGRAAILAHADRDALAAAVLLARDVRQVEGIWVYPQDELMTFFRGVVTDLRENTPIFVVGFTPTPARDVVQAASLCRGRLVWFDHRAWPPEDLDALSNALGPEMLHVRPGTGSALPPVLAWCTRRSRFSDKLVDIATGRFSQHDFERWGRLWWWRLGEIAGRPGEHRSELEPLLAGRPSDLAKQAARAETPPPPAELDFVAGRDFRVVHFGGLALVTVPVPEGLDLHMAARIARERYGAPVSLAWREGSETLELGADDVTGRRAIDVGGMVQHLDEKFSWAEALPDEDHVARIHVRELRVHPERLEEAIAEIGMGRSILEA